MAIPSKICGEVYRPAILSVGETRDPFIIAPEVQINSEVLLRLDFKRLNRSISSSETGIE